MEAENLLSHVPICSFFYTKILLYKHILSWLLQLNISFSFLQTKDKMFYYVCKIHAVSYLIRIYWTHEATGHVGYIRCTITLLQKHKDQTPDCYPYPLSPVLSHPVARGLTNLPPKPFTSSSTLSLSVSQTFPPFTPPMGIKTAPPLPHSHHHHTYKHTPIPTPNHDPVWKRMRG